MKSGLCIMLFAGLCAGVVTIPQDQDKPLEQRVQQLEKELREVRSTLDAAIGYLRENARATAALGRSLDSSESLGFTKGINPNSREVMLSGFRKWIGATQTGLPVAPKRVQAVEAGGKAK